MEGMSHSSCGSCSSGDLSGSIGSGSLSNFSGTPAYSSSLGSDSGTAYIVRERSSLDCAILDAIAYALGESKTAPEKRTDYSKQYVSVAIRYDDQSKPIERPYDGSGNSGSSDSIDARLKYSKSVGSGESDSHSFLFKNNNLISQPYRAFR